MLTVKRPTKTTILYTFSSRPSQRTLAARISSISLVLLRVIAAIVVVIFVLLEYRNTSLIQRDDILTWLENAVLTSPSGQFATLLASNIGRIWRILICLAIVWLIFRKGYTEDSLLVIRGLGVQTATTSPSYLWSSSTRFIPTSAIQDIFIHEAFKGFEVRYYLSIVVENEPAVVVVFPVSDIKIDDNILLC